MRSSILSEIQLVDKDKLLIRVDGKVLYEEAYTTQEGDWDWYHWAVGMVDNSKDLADQETEAKNLYKEWEDKRDMSRVIKKFKTRQEWLQSREYGIGASEVGTLMGINPFQTAYQLWRKKKHLDEPESENNAMLMGHLLEDAVAQRFAMETGVHIIKASTDDYCIYDDMMPIMRVSLDRTYWPEGVKHNDANKCLLECKTTQLDVDPDHLPLHWVAQVAYQMGVSGYHKGALAWLTRGRDFGFKYFEFDESMQELYKYERERVLDFWSDCIIHDQEPMVATAEDAKLKWPKNNGEMKEVIPQATMVLDHLVEVNQKLKELTKEKDSYQNWLKQFIGEADGVVDQEGKLLCTWKSTSPKKKFDERKFATEHGDLYGQYLIDGTSTRTFSLKIK